MRAYFAPCGIGLGHVSRCVPIAEALREKGIQSLFSTYLNGVHYARLHGFETVSVPSVGFRVKVDGSVDFRSSLVEPGPTILISLLRQLQAELYYMTAYDPDVVISDTRVTPILASRMLGIPSVTLLNQYQIIIPRQRRFLRLSKIIDGTTLTIIGKIWSATDYTLVTDFPWPFTLSSANLKIPKGRRKKLRLIGAVLQTRPESLPEQGVLRRRLGFREDGPLLYASISGPDMEKTYLTRVLTDILRRFPPEYSICMSLGNPQASTRPIRESSLVVYEWLKDRFDVLKACDLLISRAGHETISQAIFYGKPMILIPTPNHTEQLGNAFRAEQLGVAKVIEQSELSFESLLSSVKEVLSAESYYAAAKDLQKRFGKVDAIRSSTDVITSLIKERKPDYG